MNQVHVAFTSDFALLGPLAVSVTSILLNKSENTSLKVHVLSVGVPDWAWNSLRELPKRLNIDHAELLIYHVSRVHSSLLMKGFLSSSRPYPAASYARLLLANYVPATLDRLIYLDVDVLVRTDLYPIWSQDLEDSDLLAVMDLPHYVNHGARLLESTSPSDLVFDSSLEKFSYFQSGVLLMRLDAFRGNFVDRIFSFLDRNPYLTFPDQDALNILFYCRVGFLNPRWNQMAAVFWYEKGDALPYDPDLFHLLLSDPYIVHFSGRPKPWEPGCKNPFLEEWLFYYSKSPWQDFSFRVLDFLARNQTKIRRRLSKVFRRFYLGF